MDAVRVRVRALVRQGWTATIVLTLLVGLGAGAAMAATSAGRRTATVFDRLAAHVDAPALNLTFCPPDLVAVDEESFHRCVAYDADAERRVLAALPEVREAANGTFRSLAAAPPEAPDDTWPAAAILMRSGGVESIDGRPIVVDGRWYRHDAPEVVVNEQFRDLTGIGVGDRVTLRFATDAELGLSARDVTFHGPTITVPVVGVTRGMLDLAVTAGSASLLGDDAKVLGGRAVIDATPEAAGFGGVFLRATEGTSPDELLAAVEAAFPGRPFNASPAVGDDEREPVREAIAYEGQAVLAVGALLGLAALVVGGQAVARQSRREWADAPVLHAMGFTRGQVWMAAVLRGTVIALPAAALATALAVALSPLGPVGVGRLAETEPGVAVDGLVLALGAVIVVLATTVSAWAPVRRTGGEGIAVGSSANRVRTSLRLPPPLAIGARMGRSRADRSGLPVATALASTVAAVAIVIGAVSLTGSLDALIDEPERFGAPWDVSFGGQLTGDHEPALEVVRSHPSVAAAGSLVGTDVSINGEVAWVHGFDAFPGIDSRIPPPITSGRAPAAVDEIALGTITMHDVGVRVGDRVSVRTTVTGSEVTEMTVVGTAVVNDLYEPSPGRGGIVSPEWVTRNAPEQPHDPYIVRLDPGADVDELVTALDEVFDGTVSPPVPQTAIRNVERIRDLPGVLAAAICVLAAAAFAHALVLSVRRHRRQLAVLRSLGFTRRQVAETIAAHATVLGLAAAAVGVPLGLVVGRWGWRVVSGQIGVPNVPVTPLVSIVVAVVAVAALANLAAALPAWRARRMGIADALRAE